jgi:predicted nucleic acid-binding protein
MTSFLDTSVLVPVFLADHPHHDASMALFLTCSPGTAGCSAHSLAEVYATLTRLPAPYRAQPGHAAKCVEAIATRLRLIELTGLTTLETIRNAASENIAGGALYDALIAACALQSAADRIYSWNTKHFARLGPQVAARLTTPSIG